MSLPFVAEPVVGDSRPVAEGGVDVLAVVLGAPVGVFEFRPAGIAEDDVLDVQRRAQRAARIARRRRDEETFHGCLVEDPAVGEDVQRDAAGEAEVRRARAPLRLAGEVDHRPFGDRLDARGDVGVPLTPREVGRRGVRILRRPEALVPRPRLDAEQLEQLVGVSPPGRVVEREVGQV